MDAGHHDNLVAVEDRPAVGGVPRQHKPDPGREALRHMQDVGLGRLYPNPE